MDYLLGLAGVVLLLLILLYNRLIRAKVRARRAWAQVSVQLQRRHDLVPNLVASVKGYAAHERGLLDAVVAARSAALAVGDPSSRERAEEALGAAVGRLLMVGESYPELRADDSFRALASQLRETEDRIAFARDFANDAVARYRELTDTLPGKLIAGPLRLPRTEMFALEHERARARPDVRLGG